MSSLSTMACTPPMAHSRPSLLFPCMNWKYESHIIFCLINKNLLEEWMIKWMDGWMDESNGPLKLVWDCWYRTKKYTCVCVQTLSEDASYWLSVRRCAHPWPAPWQARVMNKETISLAPLLPKSNSMHVTQLRVNLMLLSQVPKYCL